MSAGPETVQAAQARRLELREILNRRYVYIDRKWDVIFLISAAFVIAAAGDLTRLLFAGGCNRTFMNPISNVLSQLNCAFPAGSGAITAADFDRIVNPATMVGPF